MSDSPTIDFTATRAELLAPGPDSTVPEAATHAANAAPSRLTIIRIRRTGVRRIDVWTHGGDTVVHDLHPTDATAGMCFPAAMTHSHVAVLWSSLLDDLSASAAVGLEVSISLRDLSDYQQLPADIDTVVVVTLETPTSVDRVVTCRHDLGTAIGTATGDQSDVTLVGAGALRAWGAVDSLLWHWAGDAALAPAVRI